MSIKVGSKFQVDPGSWEEVAVEIFIGVYHGARHSICITSKWLSETFLNPVIQLVPGTTIGSSDSDMAILNKNETKKAFKVFGVGLSRTGTYSLKLAFEELGFKTYHTTHYYEHMDVIKMWMNTIFLPSIKAKKFQLGKPDFQLMADSGFEATADLPMAVYYEQILEQFPDCKFVLTVRDNPQQWFRSFEAITKFTTEKPSMLVATLVPIASQHLNFLRWVFAMVNKDDKYLTCSMPFPPHNKEVAMEFYEEHNQRVRAIIPKDRLLEYNVKDGWEPLCKFLELNDCPVTPFPKTNSSRSMKVSSHFVTKLPILIALYIVWKLYQKFTGTISPLKHKKA